VDARLLADFQDGVRVLRGARRVADLGLATDLEVFALAGSQGSPLHGRFIRGVGTNAPDTRDRHGDPHPSNLHEQNII
jgi:hypothetical protein